jgi:hypothetical protein
VFRIAPIIALCAGLTGLAHSDVSAADASDTEALLVCRVGAPCGFHVPHMATATWLTRGDVRVLHGVASALPDQDVVCIVVTGPRGGSVSVGALAVRVSATRALQPGLYTASRSQSPPASAPECTHPW